MTTALKIALFLMSHKEEVAALEADGEAIFAAIQKIIQTVKDAQTAGK